MKIKSIQIGKSEKIEVFDGRIFDTGIHKKMVNGKIFLDHLGLLNDQIMGAPHHGGEGRALFVSSLDAYKFWESHLIDKIDLAPGALGENVTLESLDEPKIFVGDTFTLGETIIQATMPRIPCPLFAKKIGLRNTMELQYQCSYPGILFRVLKTGYIQAGDQLKLIENNKTTLSMINFIQMFRKSGKITQSDFKILEKTEYLPEGFLSVMKNQKRIIED